MSHTKRSRAKDFVLIGTVTLVMILNISNATAVSISLPTIGRDLNIIESKLQWIVSAYSLSSGCLLLVLGRLADLFGRKLTFLLGCACMGIFGLGCGFAQNEITIDILRALQGFGPAAAIPAAIGILAHTFPPSQIRSVAFATFAAGAPLGGALGSAIGGVLTQYTEQSWRSTFWFLAGLSAACCLGGFLSIEPDVPYTIPDKRVDWVGAILVTTGLVFVVFVLSDGSIAPDGWKTGYIIALLIVGVLFIALFVFWEWYLERVHARGGEASQKWWTPPPLMPVSIWGRKNGKVAAVLVIAFVQWCSFSGFTFWVQLYYQEYLKLSPILTLIRLLPMPVTGITLNIVIALIVARVSLVYLVTIGTLLTATSNLLFAVIDPAAPYWAFGFPAAIITVFGADFFFSTGTLFIARACLPHEQSVGGALFQTLTQLGTAFGLAISTVVFNATLKSKSNQLGVGTNAGGTNAPKAAQLAAYKGAMWTGFAFGVFGTVLAILFLRGVGVVGHRKGESHNENEKAGHKDTKAIHASN
ncbi:MFS general substrate transporter [Ganoderma sinense ZZ0214-1]|uniref:MFS general substrate transporter n=1 Tax=Ganoderma sinense ZZ0214-1 TaxID=1077348 RepID=A0A2G8S6F3_9APHY|nr:MFS general substrate transporter [Ganoderma sinense ZZ0214-1]